MKRAMLLLCLWTFAWIAPSSPRGHAEEPFYRAELVFPLHAEHNHAPGIVECPDGSLFVSWYRGSGERKADDVAVYGARRAKDGSVWSDAFLLVDTPGFPDCNTCLMVDPQQRLWLFWPIVLANTWETCLTQYLVSTDYSQPGPPRWSDRGTLWLKPADFSQKGLQLLDAELQRQNLPRTPEEQAELASFREQVGNKMYQRLGWQPRCKPIVLRDGRWLLPLYTDTFSISLMAISDDRGATWHASEPLIGFGNIQPTLLERNDGSVVAYMRENGPRKKIRASESRDRGETWSEVGTIDLPNPGAGIDGVRLANGHWVLVYNDTQEERNRLAISVSRDEGRTWTATRHLEDQPTGSYHYPAVTQGADGRIHVVYSYFVEGGKSMKHAELSESWIGP